MVTGNYKDRDATKAYLEAIWPGIRKIYAVYGGDNVDPQWRDTNLEDSPSFA